jgi:plastocyanin
MIRKLVFASLVAALALTAVAAALGQGQATPTLRATVGPGYTIALKQNGKKVTRLKAGSYRVVVADASSEHNFALRRAGRDARSLTGVAFKGTRTVTVRLTNGRWEFYCAPHEPMMRGFVAVGAGTPVVAARTTTVDDHRGHGEDEPGDDHGGHGEDEPGDDHGGHGDDD